jgi:hypothetical protein
MEIERVNGRKKEERRKKKNGGHRRRGEAPRCPPVHGPPCGEHHSGCWEEVATEVRCAITNQSARKRFDDDRARIIQMPLRTWPMTASRRRRDALQRKKGAEINSAPGIPSAPPCLLSLSGYYPREAARCHIKTPADQACLRTVLLQSRHRGAYEGHEIICDGFDPQPHSV